MIEVGSLKAAAIASFEADNPATRIRCTIRRPGSVTTYESSADRWPAFLAKITGAAVPYTSVPLTRGACKVTKRQRLKSLGVET